MTISDLDELIATIRSFKNFFIRQFGLLQSTTLNSEFSSVEFSVLDEIGNHGGYPLDSLMRKMGLDIEYLTTIINKLKKAELIMGLKRGTAGENEILRLTEFGRKKYIILNGRADKEIEETLNLIANEDREKIVVAIETLKKILSYQSGFKYSQPYIIREHQTSDIAWILRQHLLFYGTNMNWDGGRQTSIDNICKKLEQSLRLKSEICYVAEIDKQLVGSAAILKSQESKVANLRILLVSNDARGYGIGSNLVDKCNTFARLAGYKKISLLTNNLHQTARTIYHSRGYSLVQEEPIEVTGKKIILETWELYL
jgi:N-acetylglutamate synthase-like GNAT family acetyltransferase/DNA-binding MarR family transcriptional regulator